MNKNRRCAPIPTSNCEGTVITTPTNSGQCPSWDLCLPFGTRLYSQDGCVQIEKPETTPQDGVYGKIVVKNGCIVDVLSEDIPLYNGPACAPVPCPCDGEGGSGSGLLPSSVAGNLFEIDPVGGALVKLSVKEGAGISITGDGTATNPITISVKDVGGNATIYIKPGNNGVTITGDGTAKAPYTISHQEKGEERTIQGMSFDRYGHLQDYTQPTEATTINGVKAGDGIDVDVDVSTGIATVKLKEPLPNISNTFTFGGYDVELKRNQIVDIARRIQLVEATYRIGNFDVTVNKYGSIVSIVPVPQEQGIKIAASKIFKGANDSMNRSVTFTTLQDASFRISYQSTRSIPADTSLLIDGNYYPCTISGNRLDALTNARFAAGPHSIDISTTTDEGLAGDAFLDILLTTVV